MRLNPDLERILVAIYMAGKEDSDEILHITGPAHLESLGLDTDSRSRVQKFRFLEEQGFLADVGNGATVIYYHVRLTQQGRTYCEQNKLV